MCCPVGFSGEFNAVFYVKMSQIDTEIDKKPKIFQFSKPLCIFLFEFPPTSRIRMF